MQSVRHAMKGANKNGEAHAKKLFHKIKPKRTKRFFLKLFVQPLIEISDIKQKGGDTMLRKKHVLAIVGIACVWAVSLSVVYVAASPAWDLAALINYMENIGRHKIYQTNWILYNEIGPKMGQGLVGEANEGNVDTILGEWVTVFSYNPPHPKKVSLYIDTGGMVLGDKIYVLRKVSVHGAWRDLEPFIYEMVPTPVANVPNLFLVLDQLPVETTVWVLVMQTVGNPFTLWWQAIIEEV